MRRVVCISVQALFLLGGTAWAAPEPRVHLDLGGCARLDAASVTRIFAADLGAPSTDEEGPDVTTVTIECAGSRVFVRVVDPLSRKTLRRTFDSASFGDQGESRLVAIAASELVLASWAELANNPAPRVEPEGPAPSAGSLTTARATVRQHARVTPASPPPPPPSEPVGEPGALEPGDAEAASERRAVTPATPKVGPPVWRIVALGSVRGFFRDYGYLTGGVARVGEDREGLMSWALDVTVDQGRIQDQQVTSTSLGALLFAHLKTEVIVCRLGAGLRPGILAAGSLTVATWGWPLGAANCSLTPAPFVLELGGELGYGVLENHGPTLPSLRAGWYSVNFGLGMML